MFESTQTDVSAIRTSFVILLTAMGLGCGGPMSGVDAGVDVDVDAGVDDAGLGVDAGTDAGVGPEVDAGTPPRLVFGSMTVNGTPYTLSSGFGTRSLTSHLFRLGTPDTVDPRILVTLVLPGNAAAGFSEKCGGPKPILFAAQWIAADKRIAFFTLTQTCEVTLSQVATAVDQDYAGTFSGTAYFEPRSIIDPGFKVMTITNGTFIVRRTF